MKFRKKPVIVDALQFTNENAEDIVVWIAVNKGNCEAYSDSSGIRIKTLEGDMMAYPMDWIIRGVQGEFYPCKPDIFQETYEQIEPLMIQPKPMACGCFTWKHERCDL